MTAFNPTSRTVHPPPDDDPLGSAVVAALSRDLGDRLTWNCAVVLLLGLLTAGLGPLIILSLRFRTFATSEKFQLEHVTEWLERRDLATQDLTVATPRLRGAWPMLTAVGLLLAALGFGTAAGHLIATGLSVSSLASLYILYRPAGIAPFYLLLVCAAFLCHWAAVQQHWVRVGEYLVALNRRIEPVEHSRRRITAPKLWVLMGVVMLLAGCIWGLPMMLAGGAHRRYISETSAAIRRQIARNIRTLMQQQAIEPA